MSFSKALFSLGLVGLMLSSVDSSGATVARELEGVRFEPRLTVEGRDLELRGVGLLRYKVFLKAYVAALYLEPSLVEARETSTGRRLELEYFWSIPADGFAQATRDGIARNVDPEEYVKLSERIERLGELYRDVSPGDRYSLTFLPGQGTELALNGKSLGTVEGEDFAEAIFAIWLGREPLDEGLKEDLLGES
jgi:hypothetical protein